MLILFENLMFFFLGRHESFPVYPPLLYNWKNCLGILDKILEIKNPNDQLQTAHFFLHPVSFFYHGDWPSDYLTKITTPMDFGTVVSNLIEGDYQKVAEFVTHCNLVWENCILYNGGKELFLTEKAERLKEFGNEQFDALLKLDQNECDIKKNTGYRPSVEVARPEEDFLLKILHDLRLTTYTDRWTKVMHHLVIPFACVYF